MSFSFWANLGICIASLFSTWLNHADLLAEIHQEADAKKKIRKKWGLRLLWFVTGLSIVSLPFTAWESVSSEGRVSKIETDVVKNNPLNQPITSVRATAVLIVRGVKPWSHIDPVKDNRFVTLSIANRDWMQTHNTFKLRLLCKSFERFDGSEHTTWILEFGLDLMPSPTGAAFNLTPSDLVKSADEWDFFLLDAAFLGNKSEIVRGDLSLVVNTTVKHFNIPAQIAELQFGSFSDMKLIGSSETNGVIIMSGP